MTFLLSIGAWFLKNPVWLLVAGLLVALAGVGIDDGVQRMKVSSRDVTIAQKDTALKDMQAQQAENIAARESAVRKELQGQVDYANKLVGEYAGEIAELQEKQNAGETAVAAAPVVETAQGCTDPMALPVVGAFMRGLPDR